MTQIFPTEIDQMKKKKAPADPKPTANEAPSSSGAASRVFTQALTAIDDEIRGLLAGKISPGKYGKVERIAYLAKQAATFAAEERKAASAAARANSELTVVQIVAWLRQQPRDVQGQVARELHSIENRKGGVL